ncbi:MAG: LEA type 2 family protein [Nanoarchaeota archaeon]
MKALGFTICILILLVLCAAGYAGYQALQTHIEDSKVTSVTPAQEGFAINGKITVNNPGWLTIPLKQGEYTIKLENGEDLGKGTIEGKPIPPGRTALEFQQEMKWAPSGNTLIQLVLKEHVYANIKGTITLDFFGIQQLTLPFEQRIDLAEYVQTLRKGIVDNVKSLIKGFLG